MRSKRYRNRIDLKLNKKESAKAFRKNKNKEDLKFFRSKLFDAKGVQISFKHETDEGILFTSSVVKNEFKTLTEFKKFLTILTEIEDQFFEENYEMESDSIREISILFMK